jgi:hypothetical protein
MVILAYYPGKGTAIILIALVRLSGTGTSDANQLMCIFFLQQAFFCFCTTSF